MVKKLAVIFYIFGIVLAFALAIIGFWPEFEVALFDITREADESLTTLRCPMVITPADEATVSATFTNPKDRPANIFVKTHISQEYITLLKEFNHKLTLDVGETEKLEWMVSADDAVYDRFVFARVHSLRGSGIPSRQKACGILVLNIPGIGGNQLVLGLFFASLTGLLLGILLWVRTVWPFTPKEREMAISLGIITALVVLSSVISLLGFWVLSIGIFALIVLVLIGVLEHFFA